MANLESLARGLHQPCTRSYLSGGLCGCRSSKPCPEYCLWVEAHNEQNTDIRSPMRVDGCLGTNGCDLIQSVSSEPRGSADDLGLVDLHAAGRHRGISSEKHHRKASSKLITYNIYVHVNLYWLYLLRKIEEQIGCGGKKRQHSKFRCPSRDQVRPDRGGGVITTVS